MRPTLPLLSFALVASLLGACRTGVPPTGKPAQRVPELKLHGQEVLRIELEQPFRSADEHGVSKSYSSAWLVRLQVDRPDFFGEAVRFYVGDFEVPEYGGWEKGIYFKVYDRALLTRLRGRELRYRIGHTRVQSFSQSFDVPDLETLPLRQERELFPARAKPR